MTAYSYTHQQDNIEEVLRKKFNVFFDMNLTTLDMIVGVPNRALNALLKNKENDKQHILAAEIV